MTERRERGEGKNRERVEKGEREKREKREEKGGGLRLINSRKTYAKFYQAL